MPITLPELGWQAFFESQVSVEEGSSYQIARVFAHNGSQILFRSAAGEFLAATSLIESDHEGDDRQASAIAVGDWYLLDPKDHRAVRRLERKTNLYRKAAGEAVKPQLIAANIDTAFIVSSCNLDFNPSRLERYLALILDSGATPVVVLTKADLCDDPAEYRNRAQALHPGLVVETIDARNDTQASVLDCWCGTGKTIALLGSSGVGKSTLANSMCGLDIKTNEIREDDAKGRHTTTSRSIHRLLAGGWLIDNPGIRELQLPACEQGVSELFDDVVSLAADCKFRNCEHQGDAGCALEAAVVAGELEQRRLNNYLKLQSEQARNSASLAERRQRDRDLSKMYRQTISNKKRRRGG